MSLRTPTKEILVVGCGAVGAIYAYILKNSGLAHVTVVARSNYDIINSQGLTFHSKKYGKIMGWKPDRLCKSAADAADQSYSYVFITTKAIPEITRTPDILQPLLSSPYADLYPQPTYVILQNGLNVERDLHEALVKLDKGPPSIIGSALYILVNLLSPNVVEHDSFDRLSIGVHRHGNHKTTTNNSQETELLEELGNILSTGGSTLTIVPEIQRIKFQKNFWNVALSSLATLTNYRLPAAWRPPPADPTDLQYEPFVAPATRHLIEEHTLSSLKATLDELVALGHAMGFPDSQDGIPSSYPEDLMALTRSQYSDPLNTHTPSMLLDVQKGSPIEVEVIFGEVVRLAQGLNVPVPRIETLYGLLLVIQNQILRRIEGRLLMKKEEQSVAPMVVSEDEGEEESLVDAPDSTEDVEDAASAATVVDLQQIPVWLADVLQNMRASYPQDRFEAVERGPFWRIKCFDCPGKSYAPGPGESLSTFEVHLRNRIHRQRVNKRTSPQKFNS